MKFLKLLATELEGIFFTSVLAGHFIQRDKSQVTRYMSYGLLGGVRAVTAVFCSVHMRTLSASVRANAAQILLQGALRAGTQT
ncbi:hypothetical protein Anapl_12018 [Anas platyrhynchos]|uniref:Uncharacterized protein n=1 Tax=Anas platyrhynchos TaxID=8839 RepID=R0M6H5_ANAPL|nr:hypothetical protein Anapl_12018 [Anas platyrhynchos]